MDKITVYKDKAGEWRWTRRASNGSIVADSGEGHPAKGPAIAAAEREAEGADAEVVVGEPDG